MSSGELEDTLLPKTIALAVFSSDAHSSVAYATHEILLVLGLAGAFHLGKVVPISMAVAALLALVVVSYRQTVRAYPTGGGAYIVAHENLGLFPGLLAAASLLIDYVLTVAVSITAGVDAIVSAAPSVESYETLVAIGSVAFVTLANLRGVRERASSSPSRLTVGRDIRQDHLAFGPDERDCAKGNKPVARSHVDPRVAGRYRCVLEHPVANRSQVIEDAPVVRLIGPVAPGENHSAHRSGTDSLTAPSVGPARFLRPFRRSLRELRPRPKQNRIPAVWR